MNARLAPRQPMIALVAVVGLLCMAATTDRCVPEFDYEIHFTGPLTDAAEKYLIEGLIDQDPMIAYWIDRPTQSALARTTVPLDQTALQVAIEPSGLQIGYMGVLNGHPGGTQPHSGTIGTAFPEYIDTGNADSDARNFLIAKAAWFKAHGVAVPSGPQVISR